MSGRSRRRGFGYVRKLTSGRWQASYVGPDLERRSAPHPFEAKADAEGWVGAKGRGGVGAVAAASAGVRGGAAS